jgi:hypothetical protein
LLSALLLASGASAQVSIQGFDNVDKLCTTSWGAIGEKKGPTCDTSNNSGRLMDVIGLYTDNGGRIEDVDVGGGVMVPQISEFGSISTKPGGTITTLGGTMSTGTLTVDGDTTLGTGFTDKLIVNATSTFKEDATFEKDVTIGGVLTAGNGTITNLTSTNGTITNLTSTNADITNLTATNATVTNLTATNADITNLTATNATVTNLTATNADITNLTATNGTITNLTSTNADITNLTATNGTITNLTSTNADITNLTATNGTITNLTATNADITNLTATNGTITNLTSTNADITNLTATNGTITNLTSTNADVTNLTATNGTITNLTSTNATVTNLTATNGTITNLTSTNATVTNLTATNADITNLTAGTATVGTLGVTGNATIGGNLDMTGGRITNLAEPIAASDAATKNYVDVGLAKAFKEIDRNTQGIAIAMAMAGLTLPDGKNFALGANMGFFEDKQAIAIQAAIRISPNLTVTGGFGTGVQDVGTTGGRVGIQAAW